jgi:Tfp pilus assembly protein FimT
MHRPSHGRYGRGITLVETCVCLALVALLAGQAIPALQRFREQAQLRAAADALADDLRLARSEAVQLNRPVFFRISGKGAAACYLLHTGTHNGCDCAGGRAQCLAGGGSVLKATWLPATQPVKLASNVESMAFLPTRGSVSPAGSIEVRLNEQDAIRQKVAFTGRVQSCTPARRIARLRAC